MAVNSSNNGCRCRKRPFPKQESQCDDERPAKKQKLDSIKKCIPESSVFSNYLDQCQYQEIYRVLHNEMDFEDIIAKNIAEFSTGNIKRCENYKNCKNNIFTLYKHHSIYGTMDNSLLDYHRYIDKKSKICSWSQELLFCNQCSLKLIICGYSHFCQVPYIEQYDKWQCGKRVANRCYKHILCSYCNSAKCNIDKCSFHGICVECKRAICGKKRNEKYKCEYCEEYVCLECVYLLECGHYHHRNKCKISIQILLNKCVDCGKVKCWKDMIKCIKCNSNVCKKCIKFNESKVGYNKQRWKHLNCNLTSYQCVHANNLRELCL